MTESVLKDCPKCEEQLIRLIGSGSAPIFKGTGFYQTDYKNKSSKNNKSSGSGSKVKKPA
jgi:predicted nucleic acid-binding Zn ribbon protein